MIDINQTAQTTLQLVIQYAPKVLLAIFTLFLGLKLIKILVKITQKGLEKNKVDPSLTSFLDSFLSIGLKILLLISVASMLGVETTSFITLIGAAGLAVGLSLQGSLANLAGGVLILIFKPFQVGDFIETQDYQGIVKKIQIFSTHLNTLDNKRIIIPNGNLSNDSIKNYSTEPNLRLDFTVGVGYKTNIESVKKIILETVSKNSKVLASPAPTVGLSNLGDSSLDFSIKVWTENQNYIGLKPELLEALKNSFDKNNIDIPYPHTTVILQK